MPSPTPTAVTLPNGEPVHGALLAVLLIFGTVMPILATTANIYLWRVYLQDERRPRSWILALLAIAATIVNIVALYLAAISIRRLLGFPPLEWSPPVTVLGLAALELIPVYFAGVIWIRRRRWGRPPPLDGND